jgi:hypothetical protein
MYIIMSHLNKYGLWGKQENLKKLIIIIKFFAIPSPPRTQKNKNKNN